MSADPGFRQSACREGMTPEPRKANDDELNGGEHSDFLDGGLGIDFLHGGGGSDLLDGGAFDMLPDILKGDGGLDFFIFGGPPELQIGEMGNSDMIPLIEGFGITA